jgi:quercetin dioxygenase-like cupin family protein
MHITARLEHRSGVTAAWPAACSNRTQEVAGGSMSHTVRESAFFRVAELPVKELTSGIRLRSVELAALMMTFVEYPEGSVVPTHFHPHEQITYVLEGCLEVVVGDAQRLLGPGDGVRIPPNAEHSSRPVDGPARALDAWTPVPESLRVPMNRTVGSRVLAEDTIR